MKNLFLKIAVASVVVFGAVSAQGADCNCGHPAVTKSVQVVRSGVRGVRGLLGRVVRRNCGCNTCACQKSCEKSCQSCKTSVQKTKTVTKVAPNPEAKK